MNTKICCTCKLDLPLESFCKNKLIKDGHHRECKSCVKIYHQNNKAKLQAYQHQYQAVYRTENKEKLYAYIKEWAKNNPDKVRESVKRSNAKNPQRMRDYMKEYNKRKKLLKQQND
jgi:hypothetical protein